MTCSDCIFWVSDDGGEGECDAVGCPEATCRIVLYTSDDGVMFTRNKGWPPRTHPEFVTPSDFSCNSWQKAEGKN